MKKVAILHPWFLMRGGGEKVVDCWLRMYPNADVFCLFADPTQMSEQVRSAKLTTSWLDRIPLSEMFHFHLAPLYPTAIESFDLRGYDLVISVCAPVMMGGAAIPQDVPHVCYCHTPPRAWWDLYSAQRARLSIATRPLYTLAASYLRIWEFNAAQRVDTFLSNSRYIAGRVRQYFRRESEVIYPPVDTSKGFISPVTDDYYLTVGRLGREKKVELLISACNQLKRRLVIVGTGREEARLRAISGPTITLIGRAEDGALPDLYSHCRAFLFAADEDFGIVPVEAQTYGRPVVAYGHGGSLETVRVGDQQGRTDTGVYFPDQTVDSVVEGILQFERRETKFVPSEIQAHSRQFDTSQFISNFQAAVDRSNSR